MTMTKYIVSWQDVSGEQEISFITIAAALCFAKATRFEAVGDVVITEKKDNEECRKDNGQ